MRLSFNPIGNWYLVAFLVAVLVALLWLGPARERIARRRRQVLIGLRLAVIALVLLAMLRPTMVRVEMIRQSATLVLLADSSRSMEVADAAGKKTRWETELTALDDSLPVLRELAKRFEVKLFTFDDRTHPVDLKDAKLALGLRPTGHETAIGSALEDVLREEAGKRMAGVILLGDGAQRAIPPRDTAPQVPVRRLADLGCPLYTVPLGQSRGAGQVRDVAIEELLVPSSIYIKNQLNVTGQLHVEGFANQQVVAQLLVESPSGALEPVSAEKVQVQSNQRTPVELSYVPQSAGEFKVSLRTPPLPGELVTTNNEMSTFVTVNKGGLNVLYLEGVARVEQKFIRRALDPSPDIKLDILRLDARRKEVRPADLKERLRPGKYDVYILGDIDSLAFDEAELHLLAETVNRGAGLMLLGGAHAYGAGGYGRGPLADVLPIRIDRLERQNFGEAMRTDLHIPGPTQMVPTPLGLKQSFMQLGSAAQTASIWRELPPLADGANRFRELKPGALVLAESPDKVPLLVAKDYGVGRVLAFAGDSTWRWWMKGFQTAHRRFWRQTVLWLARKDETAEGRVWVALDRRRFAPGEKVEFRAGAQAPDGTPLDDALFTAEVLMPGKGQGVARLERGAHETRGVFLDAQASGDYLIRVQATQAGKILGTGQARFLVYEQDRELENPAADRGLMESLAKMTGGRAIAPEKLPQLLASILESAHQFDVETQVRRTLWDTWPFFLAFVALLAIEWFLRKRWGLV